MHDQGWRVHAWRRDPLAKAGAASATALEVRSATSMGVRIVTSVVSRKHCNGRIEVAVGDEWATVRFLWWACKEA